MKKLLVVLVLGFLTSCATMQSIAPNDRTHIFNTDYLKTFKGTISYCNEKAFPIEMADKDLGIINTGWKMNDGASKFFFGDIKMKINFMLSRTKLDKTKVMATVTAIKIGMFGSQSSVTMSEGQAKDYYKLIFDGIEKKINLEN